VYRLSRVSRKISKKGWGHDSNRDSTCLASTKALSSIFSTIKKSPKKRMASTPKVKTHEGEGFYRLLLTEFQTPFGNKVCTKSNCNLLVK
jgi:hypothetical protein